MRKLILAALLAACGAGTALAQTTQGSKVLSGNISLFTNNNEFQYFNSTSMRTEVNKQNYFRVNVEPAIGVFISDGLVLGGRLGLSYNRDLGKGDSYNNGEERTTNMYGVSFAPYLRKYISLTDRLYFQGTGYVSAGIYRSNSTSTLNPTTFVSNNTELGAGITPGLTYFVTDKFGLNTNFGSLFYRTTKFKPKEVEHKSSEKTFGVDLSLSTFSFGINYFISR